MDNNDLSYSFFDRFKIIKIKLFPDATEPGIFLKDNNQLIGHISVRDIDWRVPKGEIAYFIFKQYNGFNYGAEALNAFKNWCFTDKRFNRLFMKIGEDNLGSIKVAERSGFVYEGLLKKDYRKRKQNLIDMKIYGYTEDVELIRTDSQNSDFAKLIKDLDANLQSRNGEMQEYFNQFNKVDAIKNVIVAYVNNEAVGCGAIKQFDNNTVEVKRMFVAEDCRGKGIAGRVLNELENWAIELNYTNTVLETSNVQVEAVALYTKKGYAITENYGQYAGIETSICFKKELKKSELKKSLKKALIENNWRLFLGQNSKRFYFQNDILIEY